MLMHKGVCMLDSGPNSLLDATFLHELVAEWACDRDSYTLQGLGTSTREEAREYFAAIDSHRKQFVYAGGMQVFGSATCCVTGLL